MSFKSIICLGRTQTIERAVDAWKDEHRNAMRVRGIEDVVRELASVLEIHEEWKTSAWEDLFKDELDDVDGAGNELVTAYQNLVAAAETVAALVEQAERNGYQVEESPRVATIIEKARRTRDDLETRWPFIDPALIAAARAAAERGELESAEDILRELQGSNT